MTRDLDDLSPQQLLLAVEANREQELRAQVELLDLAVQWCHLHGDIRFDPELRVIPGSEQLVGLGGDGTPEVEEFAAAEFGAMRHQHPMAARNLLADSLDLRYRLPNTDSATHDLRVEVWVARKISFLTRQLDRAGATYVDEAIAPYLGALPAGRILALVEAKIIEADPERADQARRIAEETRFVRTARDVDGISVLVARAATGDVIVFDAMCQRIAEILGANGDQDPVAARRAKAIGILAHPAVALKLLVDAALEDGVPGRVIDDSLDPDGELAHALPHVGPDSLRPPVKLFVHLHQDALGGAPNRVARVEGHGPMLADQLRDWLGESGAQVSVTPVLDLAGQHPVDGYEFPARIVESLHQLNPVEPFPWAVNTGRRRDTDHPDPYVPLDRGGPPGQTGMHNGARLTRHHHRIKTHSGWHLVQPGPGIYLWRSPHGFWFRVDHTGTHRTGHDGVIELTPRAA